MRIDEKLGREERREMNPSLDSVSRQFIAQISGKRTFIPRRVSRGMDASEGNRGEGEDNGRERRERGRRLG